MTEVLDMAQDPQPLLPEGAELRDARARLDTFLQTDAQQLSLVFGIPDLSIRVGRDVPDPRTGGTKNEGWSTNLTTGEVTVDPKFFWERGYSEDDARYACLHEVSAHLREVITEPELTREVKAFIAPSSARPTRAALQESAARAIFQNVLSDVAGNNATHAVLPRMKYVAEQLYAEKLFPEVDYSGTPRHLQFLYKLIREEMIPGSQTVVAPEVDALLTQFRNYQGSGQDMIKYSTRYAKTHNTVMPPEEKFKIWTKVIYPEWQTLLKQDRQDSRFQSQPQAGGQGQPGEQPQSGEPSGARPDEQAERSDADFSRYYEQYREEHHPEAISEEEHDAIEQSVHEQEAAKRQERREQARQADPAYQRDQQLRQETGHSLAEVTQYNKERERWSSAIDEVRDIYSSLLHEHLGVHRKLRGGHTEGAVLTPDRLADTWVDIKRGEPEPKAFSDYEKRVSERELTGKTDYVFVFDRSGSMQGEKSAAAASAAVICMEALTGIQDEVAGMRRDNGIDVDVDIRTAIYAFNDRISNPKPLSRGLDFKEQLDTYAEVRSPGGGNADSHVLQLITELPRDTDRRQILIVVSDGEADNPSLARARVEQLRRSGWSVYGISIGSEAAVELYSPDARRVDDPAVLPDAMKDLIKDTI